MSVIAIIGAGPGMGLSIAKVFGGRGYKVALISPEPKVLDELVAGLAKQGIESAAFTASVMDRETIATSLAAVRERFGQIDVLEYSPKDPTLPLASATGLSYENVQKQIDFYAHGAVAAVNAVLPEMVARGTGTILFTTGAASVYPVLGQELFANVGAAAAWLRNWAHALHGVVGAKGVQVGHVAIATWIGSKPGAGPDDIAPLYWELHTRRDQIEKVFELK